VSDQGLSGRVRSWWASGAVERIRDREIFVRRAEGEDPLLLFRHRASARHEPDGGHACNGSMILERASLTWGQKLLRSHAAV